MKSFTIGPITGRLRLYVLEDRVTCVHVRDGEPAVQPTGTITDKDGNVWSYELCRICSAMHTLTPEQLVEQDFRNALTRVMQEDEQRDEGTT